ncbi:MAG: HD domain-containing protein [Nitrospiraceae bacterium]|nr:HD domain-containing protein [Nitrospiraceae bacterium]
MPLTRSARVEEYLRLLESRIPPKTLEHCISAAEYMTTFREEVGVTVVQCEQAGLLHDLCKKMKADEMLASAVQYGIEPNETQQANPKLLHGPLAAEQCRRTLGIDDEAVYEAIYWHTTGRPGLGSLGRALYFADFAEPLRSFPEAVEARERLQEEGFERALRYAAEKKLERIRLKSHADPVTEAFHAWLQAGE